MKPQFVRCEFCKSEIMESCQLATRKKTIDGKEHVFCCAHCAQRFEKKRSK